MIPRLRLVLQLPTLLFALVLLIGCDSAGDNGEGGSGGRNIVLSIDAGASIVAKGGSLTLSATAADDDGNPASTGTVAWETSDASIATVEPDGRVRGMMRGSVTITANASGATTSVDIIVLDLSGRWTATVPDPQAPGGVNRIVYELEHAGIRVTGTYQNDGGFPPITSVNRGTISGILTIGRASTTIAQTVRIPGSPCNLVWENTLVVTGVGTAISTLRPQSPTVTFRSDTCTATGSLRVAEVAFEG